MVAYREMRYCVRLPTAAETRLPVVGSRGDSEGAHSVYKHLTPTLELTSQQVPVIRVDGHLSVCFFDVCRQPERDLSCFRLLTLESSEVRCNW